jgi:hypothetical protein
VLPVYLTAEQHRALQELSQRTGRSMSNLIRDMTSREPGSSGAHGQIRISR